MQSLISIYLLFGICCIFGVDALLTTSSGKNLVSVTTLLKGNHPRKHSICLADTTKASVIDTALKTAGLESLPILLPSQARFAEVQTLYKSLQCDSDNVNLRDVNRATLLAGDWLTLATDLPYLSYEVPLQKFLMLPPNLLKSDSNATPMTATLAGILQVVGDFNKAGQNDKVDYSNKILFKVTGFGSTFASVTYGNCRVSDDAERPNRLDVEFTGRCIEVIEGDATELEELFASLGDPAAIRGFVNNNQMSLKGWSDVVYLDEEATTRVMKGNAGHFYILTRKTK